MTKITPRFPERGSQQYLLHSVHIWLAGADRPVIVRADHALHRTLEVSHISPITGEEMPYHITSITPGVQDQTATNIIVLRARYHVGGRTNPIVHLAPSDFHRLLLLFEYFDDGPDTVAVAGAGMYRMRTIYGQGLAA